MKNQKNCPDRITAALLAFFLGSLGAHKFYLGKTKQGILFIVFAITGIPSIIAFIDFIKYLVMGDNEWANRWGRGDL